MLGKRRSKLDPKTMSRVVVIKGHGHTLDIDVNGKREFIASVRVRAAAGNIELQESVDPHTYSVREDRSRTLGDKDTSLQTPESRSSGILEKGKINRFIQENRVDFRIVPPRP